MNQSSLSIVETIDLGSVEGKKTKDCLSGCLEVYRNADINRSLPAEQPPADACVITVFSPRESMSFVDWAAYIIGVSRRMSIESLSKLLKERSHLLTLVQAEEITERQKEKKDMFFFVGDNDDDVSVVVISKNRYANIFQFGVCGSWGGDTNRIFVPNFKAKKI